ncbi:hypothetical protein BDK61_2878 [Haloarcula quadrata]|uniref:Uncharacterized protein n=1 Tax=Haloarcula quadrata TaxID=182779 RepID=A0A495R849_9EURY|nr:hypothetical protein [Haloarcula quadrata]RKS83493.1 hypothetical protein BDK61_2878 [Haloarcula quadrata]
MTDEIRSASEVEGVSDREQEFYQGKIEDMEEKQGRLSQPAYVRFGVDAMIDGVWTIDDICELTGVPRSTVEETVEQELYRGNIEHAEDLATGGKFKSGFVTVDE